MKRCLKKNLSMLRDKSLSQIGWAYACRLPGLPDSPGLLLSSEGSQYLKGEKWGLDLLFCQARSLCACGIFSLFSPTFCSICRYHKNESILMPMKCAQEEILVNGTCNPGYKVAVGMCVKPGDLMLRCSLPAHTYSLYHRGVFTSQFATGNPGCGYYLPDGICSLDSSSGIKCLGP